MLMLLACIEEKPDRTHGSDTGGPADTSVPAETGDSSPFDWEQLGFAQVRTSWDVDGVTVSLAMHTCDTTAVTPWIGTVRQTGPGDGTGDGTGEAWVEMDADLSAPLFGRVATDGPAEAGCDTAATWRYGLVATLEGPPATMRLAGPITVLRTCDGVEQSTVYDVDVSTEIEADNGSECC
jgi:hypothetical protein